MDRNDEISDNYRHKIRELLESESEKDNLSGLNRSEADELWENISEELDIDEVWERLATGLDSVMPVLPRRRLIRISIPALVMIVLIIITVKDVDHFLQPVRYEQETVTVIDGQVAEGNINNKVDYPESEKPVGTEILSVSRKSDSNIKEVTAEEETNTGLNETTNSVPGNVADKDASDSSALKASTPLFSKTGFSYDNYGIPGIPFSGYPENLNPGLTEIQDILQTGWNSGIPGSLYLSNNRARYSAGLITTFKNTWLLSNETLEGFKSKSENTTEIVFYPDLGLSLIYMLNDKWGLQADAFLSSNTGQDYFEYYGGHYSRKKITLNYTTAVFSVKYRVIKNNNPVASINLLAGTSISVLHYAYLYYTYEKYYSENEIYRKSTSEPENIGLYYRKFDLGVRLGGELEFKLSNQLSLAPGTFVSVGIPNIFKGSEDIPGYLKRTRNGSAEIRLGIYYHFK